MLGKITLFATIALSLARPDPSPADGRVLWEANDRCPPDRHFLIQHEWDCTKFYYCEYGMKYITPRDCAPGTEFSYDLQVCVHPVSANCNLPGVSPTDSPTTTTTYPTWMPTTTTQAPTTTPTQPPTTTPTQPLTTTTTQPPTTAPTQPPTTTTTQPPTTTPTQPPTTPTTLAPSGTLPNGCPADSNIHHLLPHEECNKYYQCVLGQKVERTCTFGTYFNYKTQICDWPHNVECAGTTEPPFVPTTEPSTVPPTIPPTVPSTVPPTLAPSGTLPNGCPADFNIHHLLPHEECNKYYQCVLGQKVERTCTFGTYFNYKTQVCDWPHNVECAGITEPPFVPTSGPSTAPPTIPPTVPSTALPTAPPTLGPSITLPNGCPADFNIHHLLPHETECNKFYYCVFGEKVERECAPGTHFNPAIQVCDWPANVGCVSTNTSPPPFIPTTLPPTVPPTIPPTIPPTLGPSITLPNGCPADFNIHHLLPHETECNKFYYCVFGEKVERECAPGTHFNPAIQVCDWPANVGCVSTSTTPPPFVPTTAPSTIPPTVPPTLGPSVILPNGCPADFNIQYFLPHETECNKFYFCIFGEKVERECTPGTHFNPAIQVCDWPANVGCVSTSATPPPFVPTTVPPTIPPTVPPTLGPSVTLPNGCPADFNIHHLLPHETECHKFYYCVFGEKVERECAPGTHFNPAIQVCDWPANVGCVSTNTSPPPFIPTTLPLTVPPTIPPTIPPTLGPSITLPNGCPADFNIHHLLPHETECNKFYYCVFGEKVERECAPGTHFNPAIQVCDWPANVGCISTSTTPPPFVPTTAPPTIPPTVPPTLGPSVTLPNGCPADFNIQYFLPHETECNKFYFCIFGEKVERECTPGTHFNPAIQICDWPENVDCDIGGHVDPNKCASCNVRPWAHATDCDKFWQCAGDTATITICSEGLHYNPSTYTCDFICNAGCVRGKSQATEYADGVKLFLPWDMVDSEVERLIEITLHEDSYEIV